MASLFAKLFRRSTGPAPPTPDPATATNPPDRPPPREPSAGSIADMRRNYAVPPLLETDALPSPIDQFQAWFSEAKMAGIAEANAMTLATASADGRPAARIVLLKGLSETGFVFYTNYDSPKARDLDSNPRAELLFFWDRLHRQVRVAGDIERVESEVTQRYFQSRPRDSQLGAWASEQSTVIEHRDALHEQFEAIKNRYAEQDQVPVPPFWGGFRLKPHTLEFWQGQPNRLHDRLRYRRDPNEDGRWIIERLSP